jgi:holo-[acyl-carrier protein] synthase
MDVVDVRRIAAIRRRYSGLELELVFTAVEQRRAEASGRPDLRYAVSFGVKESVGKALGVGMAGIDWCDVSGVLRGSVLDVTLAGAAARLAVLQGIAGWTATFAAWGDCVLVTVIAVAA